MGRNSIVTIEKIIVAARELFAHYGFLKTTIEDIAKSLHVGKSSLYYHFKDKEEIFKAVVDQDIFLIKERVTEALKAAPSPQEKLRVYTVIRMTFFKEYITVFRVFKDEYLHQYAFIQKIREGYDAYEESLIRSIMEEGNRTGVFSIEDIPLTSSTIFAAIKGMEYDWAHRFDSATIEKNVNALLYVLFFGMMKR